MIHDTNEAFSTFWKYEPTPGNLDSHWYEFLYDGQTGAEITDNTITLHYVDGLRGDDDLTANGVIVDPGAPAVSPPTFAATFTEDSLPVLIQDAGLTLEGASSAAGPIGGEFQLNTYTANRQELFGWTGGRTVATDIHGNFVVVWSGRGPDGSEYGVLGQRYDTSGRSGRWRISGQHVHQQRPKFPIRRNG